MGRARGSGRGRGRGGRPAARGQTAGYKRPPCPNGAWLEKYTTKGGKVKWRTWYKTSFKRPQYIERSVKLIEGERHARRPSARVKAEGLQYASEKFTAGGFEGNTSSWATAVKMPDEKEAEDVGWQPGPIVRDLPTFKGPTPGPTDPRLNASATAMAFFNSQITERFRRKVQEYTREKVQEYRTAHPLWRAQTIEQSMGVKEDIPAFLEPDNFDAFDNVFTLWLLAKLRIARLKPEIAGCALWGQLKGAEALYDAQLDGLITFNQYTWCNRHMSFADRDPVAPADDEDDDEGGGESESEEEDEEDEGEEQEGEESEEGEDEEAGGEEDESSDVEFTIKGAGGTHRKRRELTEIACEDMAMAYNPHQHCGLDDGVRTTKHWDKVRIRFKAAVHSGSLVNFLNDCRTNYTIWFEEMNWRSKKLEGKDINSKLNVLKRAANVLLQKQHNSLGHSTAAYCISMDRGYGDITAQQHVWDEHRVYTNAMIATNRIGLPREYIQAVQEDLKECPKGCTHKTEKNCRKFMWT